jgi:cysteine-rich repeat protein
MQRAFLNTLRSHRNLLLVGALLGGATAGCDPKQIGDETAGKTDADTETTGDLPQACEDGATKEAGDGCNVCVCDSGAWACTLLACEETETSDSEGTTTGDDDDGATTDDEPQVCGDDEEQSRSSNCLPPEPSCGDGAVQPENGEECDDGNLEDGDGCSSDCQLPKDPSPGLCAEPSPDDPLTLEEVALVGDVLAVKLAYGGGCEEHEIGYCWDGAFAESDPVQVWTRIAHDAKNDPCDAWVQQSLEFDLSDLKQSYQQAYQTQAGTIVIHLEGWPASITYTF